jgi:hypothetical protein
LENHSPVGANGVLNSNNPVKDTDLVNSSASRKNGTVASDKKEVKEDVRMGMGPPRVAVHNKRDAWKQSAAAITTSAVVSLSLCKLMG